jgi:hypothetical protein
MKMTARTRRLPAAMLAPSRSRLQAPIVSQQGTARAPFSLREPELHGPADSERAQLLGFQVASLPSSPRTGQENRTGLPDRLKSRVESLSGIPLDDVKVHYDSPQPAWLGSLAHTQGNEIHVGPGQRQHLAHEAWHVVQQKQGRVKCLGPLGINDSPELEREATLMGARAQSESATLSKTEAAAFRSAATSTGSATKPVQLMKDGTQMAKLIKAIVHGADSKVMGDFFSRVDLEERWKGKRINWNNARTNFAPKKPPSAKELMDTTLSAIADAAGQIRLDRGNPYLVKPDDLD